MFGDSNIILLQYFQYTGVCDVAAIGEVECLEVRISSCYFRHTDVGDVAAPIEVE